MTHPDEAAFQAALDVDNLDHFTRLVFADWLEERGDIRAEGYRALGTLKVCAARWSDYSLVLGEPRWGFHDGGGASGMLWDVWLAVRDRHRLPEPWFDRVGASFYWAWPPGTGGATTRTDIEDWVATEFMWLTLATRRAVVESPEYRVRS